MEAEEHVRLGRLNEALADLQADVRKRPADPKLRVFLFQLLSVMGQWDRALTQLQVVGELDPATMAMVQTYREALRCELLRREVFAGKRSPLFFGEPAEWMALLLSALKLSAEKRYDEAQALREKAFEAAPTTAGRIDDQPFEWLADADTRLGPMIEAIVNGRYYWIPIQRLSTIQLEKPSDLRDMVWTPATLTLENGGESVALIPTRYPGSENASDSRLTMARATEWVELPSGLFEGVGQRVLTTNNGEHALLDIRVVQLGAAAEAPAAEATS